MASKKSAGTSRRTRITRADLEKNASLTMDVVSDPHNFAPILLKAGGVIRPSPTAYEMMATMLPVARKRASH